MKKAVTHLSPAAILLGLLMGLWSIAPAAILPEGFAEIEIAEELDPTFMALAPDGRIFVCEKSGRVRIVRDGQMLPQPFMVLEVDNFNERGLGGIAFHPDFAQNGYFYLYYTVKNANHNRISRFTAQGDFVVPGSEVVLMDLDQLNGTIHNSGNMLFGPDGKLYISVGDGADAAAAQSLNSRHGKFLRLNADGSIPQDNPFYTQTTGDNRAIWALGFRNSYTFSFQPGTGMLFANDVGGGEYEEVNHVEAGKNYGWPVIEGFRNGQNPPANYQDPMHAYDHTVGCAVIASTFYNPATASFPAKYVGKYFFADYCQGFVKVMNPQSGAIEEIFATGVNRPLQMLVTPNGDMYYLARAGLGGGSMVDNTSTTNGSLWRVFYQGIGAPIVSVQPQPVTIPEGENATFAVGASGSPPYTFQWQKNEVDIPGATASVYVFPAATLADSGSFFRCIVGNSYGTATSLGALLSVTTNRRPDPVIEFPLAGTTWRAGDTIYFRGSATDPEDGALGPDELTWKIDLFHDDHNHPALQAESGITEGTYIIPRQGEVDDNIWLRIYLTAKDINGLTRTVYREIFPEKTNVTLDTRPSGLRLNIDGKEVITPYVFPAVIGIRHSVQAPRGQSARDSVYTFKQYRGLQTEAVFNFFAEETPRTYVAEYEGVGLSNGQGLLGIYYKDNGDEEFTFSEDPALFRIDSTVNFDWMGEGPAAGIGPDDFAVRWTGEVQPLFTEDITFMASSDDGVRLWVNNILVIDQWVLQGVTTTEGTLGLQAGKKYPIRFEYFERGGDAVAKLLWSSDRTPEQVIPKRQLFPGDRFGIPKDPALFEVRAFPNPLPPSEQLQVQISATQADNLEMGLYDTQGRCVWYEKRALTGSLTDIDIDTAPLRAGLYVLHIRGSKYVGKVLKIVKL
ncbi:MAG: T9SS C-terminal target domain-containing protein [Bacteroidetes bacterium]|nr:MAG: T9SS C-terminal target domain-containing protein [Bacteroidota bacterium]